MKGSELFIKALENEGVKYIFGIPGEENLDFLNALSNSSINFITTRHEQAAGFMAATCGRLTGSAGVCLSTLGPGATNLVTAAAYAQLGAMPMLMITGQKSIKHSKQGHFQIIDVVSMFKPLSKHTKQIVNSNLIGALVRESFRIAEEERPGVVHLELPEDIATEESDGDIYSRTLLRRPIAEKKAIDKAVSMIQSAKRPLILIGAGSNRKLISKMLTDFVNETGIPFIDTQMGKGVVDERNKLYLGTAATSTDDFVHCSFKKADLIINIGHDITEKPPFMMKEITAEVIHVNFFPANIDEVYFPHHEVIGDISNAIWQIKEKLILQKNWDFNFFIKSKKRLENNINSKSESNKFPILPQKIVTEVRKVMSYDSIVTLDNGMYKIWFARNYKAYQPNSLLLDNALATMGAGLPSAIAAKIINPDKKVMAVVGDGGFMMNSQEIETAVRLKLDLTILIINDNGFGMIKWKQNYFKKSSPSLDFYNPNFVKYAQSYGAKGYRVEKTSDLFNILNKALNSKGVNIVEVPVDYSENVILFNDELKNMVC